MIPTDLLEVKTYKQPSGVVIQLRRLHGGFERLVSGHPQQWGTTVSGDGSPQLRMVGWQDFEERIGSELL